MSTVAIVVTESEVRRSVSNARTHLERAAEEVVWQIENEAWKVLGYDSWDAMREGEYGGAACMVPSGSRPRITARLRALGLTQQQTGDTLGVDRTTVRNDLNGNFHIEDLPETVTNSRGQQRPATYKPRVDTETGEVSDEAPPAPPRPRRKPLPDEARNAGWELRKSVERLGRIAADDRFQPNKEAVAPHLRGHLENAIEVCQNLLDRITE